MKFIYLLKFLRKCLTASLFITIVTKLIILATVLKNGDSRKFMIITYIIPASSMDGSDSGKIICSYIHMRVDEHIWGEP